MFQISTSVTTGAATVFSPGTGSATVNLSGISTSGENMDSSSPGTDSVIGNITVTGLDHTFSPQAIVNIPYVIQVTIKDYGSAFTTGGAFGSVNVNITGTLTGTLGAGNRVNIQTNTYGANPGSVFVGNDQFNIDLTLPQNYAPPGSSTTGTLSAHFTGVTNGGIPEPSTLVLASLGLVGLSVPALRRWRNAASA
jgi:hypothetical protein